MAMSLTYHARPQCIIEKLLITTEGLYTKDFEPISITVVKRTYINFESYLKIYIFHLFLETFS